MRYAIKCTPGGLLRDEQTGDVIYFNSHAEAETEAQRLTERANLPGVQYAPVAAPDAPSLQ